MNNETRFCVIDGNISQQTIELGRRLSLLDPFGPVVEAKQIGHDVSGRQNHAFRNGGVGARVGKGGPLLLLRTK